jgi:O-antigen/teichoic acid export membrane protein
MTEIASFDESGETSLARRSIRGAAWNYGGAIVITVGQLAYTALTARLISPAEFGAYAVAQAFLAVVGYFTLGTVGNAIIRHPSLSRRIVGTGVVMTAIAGATVAVVVLATAGIWAHVWRAPEATSLLRLYAPQMLLTALAIVPLALLRRELRYRAASLIETSSVLVGFALGAAFAVELRDARALVLGQVAGAAALAVFSIAAARSELGVAYGRAEARSLFSFSAQVSLQNLGHYVNTILPSFAISRSLGATSLGFYSRGSVLVGLPLTFLAQGVTKTLYPVYPRFRNDAAECKRMMIDVASVTTAFVWPLFGALAGLAPLVVEILLGSQWTPVASIVGPLCIYASLNFAYAIVTSFAESFAYLRQIWLVQVVWTLVLVGALGAAALEDAGIRTIVFIAAGIMAAVHVLQIVILARLGTIDAARTLRAELWAASLAIVWYLATMLTNHELSDRPLGVQIGGSGAVLLFLTAASWVALPHLPAGRAFASRGIRITLRPKVTPSS